MNNSNVNLNMSVKPVYKTVLSYGDCDIVPNSALILRENELLDESERRIELLRVLSDDYLSSARILFDSFLKTFHETNNGDMAIIKQSVLVPIGYLCRHAVELKLKQHLYIHNHSFINEHCIGKLFFEFDWSNFVDKFWYKQLVQFVNDIDKLDIDGFRLRYGFDTHGHLYDWDSYVFNPDYFIKNTEYLFSVFDKYSSKFCLK